MGSPLLIVDVSGLAHRALHTTGGLSHRGVDTGVAFGVFRDVLGLCEDLGTARVAWCFDGGHDCRTKIFPAYKRNRRKELTDEERDALRSMRRQVYLMRTEWLPSAGCRNLFWRDGYEADDVIAAVCRRELGPRDRAVIVSSDHDLWQLLDANVSIWSPSGRRPVTAESFRGEWGIEPRDWARVLAVAGCDGDGVPGIEGVGEKTAVQWLTGRLNPKGRKWAAIRDGAAAIERNAALVRLPFPGVGRFPLAEGERVEWGPLLRELGMVSLVDGRRGGRGLPVEFSGKRPR